MLVHNAIESLGGAGLHPIKIMDLDDEERFLARGPEDVPIMEKFLSAPSAPRHDVWSTGGGEYNLLGRGGFPAAGFRSLRAIRSGASVEEARNEQRRNASEIASKDALPRGLRLPLGKLRAGCQKAFKLGEGGQILSRACERDGFSDSSTSALWCADYRMA